MKKLLLLTLAACLIFSAMAFGRDVPNPLEWQLKVGNVDGSAMTVGINKEISVPVWGRNDPGDAFDSVTVMHIPLKSANSAIASRWYVDSLIPQHALMEQVRMTFWDDISYLAPIAQGTDSLNQSLLGIAYISDPYDPWKFFWYPDGNFHFICYFKMTTVNDEALIGQTVCPFAEGYDPRNHALTWGMQDGSTTVKPVATYGCLFFSPNQASVWVAPTADTVALGACQGLFLHGTDSDTDQPLTITGPDGFLLTGGNGDVQGYWYPTEVGTFDLTFDLLDGQGDIPLNVTVIVTIAPGTSELSIDCVSGTPGEYVEVPVNLTNCDLVGGFTALIRTDPTALTYAGIIFTGRDFMGQEYNRVTVTPLGPGTVRVVWIANIPNGEDHEVMAAGSGPIFKVKYLVASGFPFDVSIPVTFDASDDPSMHDNTYSDSTGYVFYQPAKTPGCVYTQNPAAFRGDPNMNCIFYEIADAVVVARRLAYTDVVWDENNDGLSTTCTSGVVYYHNDDATQEAGADLNGNGFADIADLVWFINVINGIALPPSKVDPSTGSAQISMQDNAVMVNSDIELGGVLVKINHSTDIGAPVVANGMDMVYSDQNGVMTVVIYSLSANRIPVGSQTLFTLSGTGTIGESQLADSQGRLLGAYKPVVPVSYGLDQNFPNPFNAQTKISFDMQNAGNASIQIYNITGQLVKTISGQFEAGTQSVIWDATGTSSGIYFYKLTAGDFTKTMKMTLLK